MGDCVLLAGEPPIEVTLRTSARARRLSLRVSSLDGRVTLTVPRGTSQRAALAFARDKVEWIRGHLDARVADVRPMPGETLPLFGTPHRIVAGGGRVVRLGAGVIHVPETGVEATPARLAAFVKLRARDRLVEAAARHANALGRTHGRVTLRDTRSRWGSCSAQGNLMFSWRLAMAPPEVLDYVAAHEVAHLVEMNHSPAFWRVVETLTPDYQTPRRWLRKNGVALHRYRFRD